VPGKDRNGISIVGAQGNRIIVLLLRAMGEATDNLRVDRHSYFRATERWPVQFTKPAQEARRGIGDPVTTTPSIGVGFLFRCRRINTVSWLR